MATVQELISDTEQHLFTGQTEDLNEVLTTFTSVLAPGRTTIAFREDVSNMGVGTRIAIDLEIFQVWSVDTAAKTAVVVGQRGGSAAATHVAGALALISPKFAPFRILRALQQELAGLSTPSLGLWRPVVLSLPVTPTIVGYDVAGQLSAEIINVHRVQSRSVSGRLDWQEVPGWRLQRGLPTTDFPSEMAILIPSGAVPAGAPVRAILRARYKPLGDVLSADVEATTGMVAYAHDILSMGAAIRLYVPRELKRGFTESQPEPRRGAEVPATAQTQAIAGIRGLYQQRIRDHASYLSTLYPSHPY